MEQPRYCFMHNIQFDSDQLFEDHNEICEDMLSQSNVCRQHAVDGSMCGKFFKNTTELVEHTLEEHRVIMCEVCDAQSTDPVKMKSHCHLKGNHKSIHASE